MNARIVYRSDVVHALTPSWFVLCGADIQDVGRKIPARTDDTVTCKRCLVMMDKKGQIA